MINVNEMRKLGETLRAARLAQGLAVNQVAARSGFTDSEYERLEESRSLPPAALRLHDLESALAIKKGTLKPLADRYKREMVKFLEAFGPEAQALVGALKPYSSYDVKEIIANTILRWRAKFPGIACEDPDAPTGLPDDGHKKKYGRRQVVHFDEKGKRL
jgi:transcriptional regulator with XRE-family HTH domain